jgi:NAD(P)-dependent dehydrogenase (short-subunit alcohol dehydrogenase family)
MNFIDPSQLYINRQQRLTGKIALVTGSSSGQGRAISLALADEGAFVICTDLKKEASALGFEEDIGVDTDEVVRNRGGKSVFSRADVTSSADMVELTHFVKKQFGRIDIWVNNAGIFAGTKSIDDEDPSTFLATLSVNVTGVWLGCKSAVSIMREQSLSGRCRGKIVNIGSIAGSIGQPDVTSYSTSKGAVHNLTRALAIECAPNFINVNCIAPGYMPTAMTHSYFAADNAAAAVDALHPWPTRGFPADVAAAVSSLSSPGADWITGAILPVDGGFTAR